MNKTITRSLTAFLLLGITILSTNCGTTGNPPEEIPTPQECVVGVSEPCSLLNNDLPGLCKYGVRVCNEPGKWGACADEILPVAELCDHVDNNCDGEVDEDCPCTEGQTQPCYSDTVDTLGVGPCKGGTQTCDKKGVWGVCVGEVLPQPDTCDGLDNNCNGQIDELTMLTCGTGACTVTVPACVTVDGVVTANYCTPKMPTLEVCDTIDNDCDGLIDETFPEKGKPCDDSGELGVCAKGIYTCEPGGNLECHPNPVVTPTTETCDGLDNDCDGITDNHIPGQGVQCSTGFDGACSAGTMQCEPLIGLFCKQNTSGTPETCNAQDDDCDGVVDDGNFCCPDGEKSGNESDVDCGGTCTSKCGIGQGCNSTADCGTGVCVDGVCCATDCYGVCQACNVPGKKGTCSPVPYGQDDELICSGDIVSCNGASKCLGEPGATCGVENWLCLSGKCVGGKCL